MNKTLIAVGFFVLIGLAIIGAVVLSLMRPDQVPTFIGAMSTLLGIGSAAVLSIYGLGRQGKQLDTIKANTNGTLSQLMAENARLTARLETVAFGESADPGTGQHRA